MTASELAALLHGREYRNEITLAEEASAKASGLVVAFGASDDLMEFRGAINDEVGAYDGTTVRIDGEGIAPTWPADSDEGWSESEAEDYFRRKAAGFKEIHAIWSPQDMPDTSWRFATAIPHATFDVMEDGDIYCRGIVFSLTNLG